MITLLFRICFCVLIGPLKVETMSSVMGDETHLENGGTLLTPPPKYKRQKVSGVREIPLSCGSNVASLCKPIKAKGVQGDDALNVDDVSKDVLIDVGSYGEKGGDLCESEKEGVEFTASSLATCDEVQYNKELKNFSDEKPNTFEEIRVFENKHILPNEIYDTSSDLMGVRLEGVSVEQRLLPHYPIPPSFVSKEQIYPLPRRVSALCLLPVVGKPDTKMIEAGKLNQNEENLEGDKNYENTIEGIFSGKSDYAHGVAVEINMQAPMFGQSSEFMGRENTFVDNNAQQHVQCVEQLGYGGKDGSNIGNSPDRLQNSTMVYVKEKNKNEKSFGASSNNIEFQEENIFADIDIEQNVIVQALTCERERKGKKHDSDAQENSMVIVPYVKEMEANKVSRLSGLRGDGDSLQNDQVLPTPHDCGFAVPATVAGPSSDGGARRKVRETLKLFQALVRKLLQGEETKWIGKGKARNRVDIGASNVLKEKGMYINTDKVIGEVPGVEIGDLFSYRIELAVIGIHSPLQSGIDTIKQGKNYFAISVVASGGYDNDVGSSDVLIYTGQGGNPIGADKEAGDQKLERGNLALKNCIDKKNPVRVVRGFKEAKPADKGGGKPKMVSTYTYDGLYTVERYWHDLAHHGKLVYKFELKRIPGQRQLSWKEVKQAKKCKVREGCCVDDISNGKDKPPICAINTIDDEKPPAFTYITTMMYPEWCSPVPPMGCNCKDGCSDSNCCTCVVKNGGEIPFNLNGAIVVAKPLVYECGPSCNCPPSCPNRVSQHGIKLPLEIFKTESRGWGVRCLSTISSGSFICEYIGELLDDKQAEQRVGSDEYLFDIGQNYNDTTLWDGLSALMPNMPSISSDVVANIGFTIDAARYGNIGRFINHSCSPNLYAQNVLYDHEDKRIPHIMLFAAENIPPLQELSYHYNYTVDQVFDSKGNIKKKNCHCGSDECTGRMY